MPGPADYQNEVYLRGLAGERPAFPVAPADLEAAACAAMSPEALGYVAGGATSGSTVAANRAAFERWRIVPRMLRGVGDTRELATTVCGTAMPAPVLLGPVGVQSIIHPAGELASARAAAAAGIPFVQSTAASHDLEAVAEANGDGPRWYQLYWPKDGELATSLVQRAERAGYTAIVVTLDTWLLGWRPRDLTAGYLPFLRGIGIANYVSDPVFRSRLATPPEEDPQAAVLQWVVTFADPTLTWADLAWLREQTSLPILLKGVLSPLDAQAALDAGVDGLVVSNHGGRQVDGAVAALDALPAVVERVAGRIPVLFDSGIRTGADAVKALALGAQAVLLGRHYLWGLALGGEAGVTHVLKTFLADLDITLALSGHRSVKELSPDLLVRNV